MKTDELKPVRCGCGGEAEARASCFMTVTELYLVQCKRCGTATLLKETEAEAIEAWNRAMSHTERKTGKWIDDCCSCCGVSKYNYIKMVDDECGPFGTWNFCPNCGADMRGDR